MTSNTKLYKEESFANITVHTSSQTGSLPHLYALIHNLGCTTILFSIIICVGLFSNILVVATVARWQKMQTPCNLLIANVCAAELAVCIFAAPLRIIEIYRSWIFGDVMCYILTPLQDVFVVVSFVTHTVIALERHHAIVTPMKPKISRKRVKTLVPVIWIACYLTDGVPTMIFL